MTYSTLAGKPIHHKDCVTFVLRIPPDLKAELERLAAENSRSLSSQAIYMLQQAVKEGQS